MVTSFVVHSVRFLRFNLLRGSISTLTNEEMAEGKRRNLQKTHNPATKKTPDFGVSEVFLPGETQAMLSFSRSCRSRLLLRHLQ